jgi:ribosome biogenesis GTPase / thiamine phosphate phosphatase
MLSIQFETLRRIGFTNAFFAQLADIPDTPTTHLMRIIEVHKGWLTLHNGQSPCSARVLARVITALEAEGIQLAVGDWVIVEHTALNEWWITSRLSPANHLSRRAFDGRRQSVASNIDTALLVMGLDHDFNLRRLERYMAMVAAADIAPVIVLTKADTVNNAEQRMTEVTKRIGSRYPVFAINARDTNSTQQLIPWLDAGQTLCLLGSSGAGKSTLTNTLANAEQHTGTIRADDSRGRHTTTFRSMHFCEQGACIIDAPGLRTLRPDGDDDCINAAFEDIEQWAVQCQFRNCRHESEPGCAVRAHCEPDRLFNYHKLVRDMQRSQQTPLERIAERSRWKALMKSASARGRQKRQ